MKTISFSDGIVKILDQTVLPQKVQYVECQTYEEVARCIEVMNIRGAPAIGVAAGFGLAVAAYHSTKENIKDFRKEMKEAAERLRITRPTAVNLFWAIDRVINLLEKFNNLQELKEQIINEAYAIAKEDYEINRAMGEHGATLIKDGANISTHCNAGELATSGGYGTAIGVIKVAAEQGKKLHVYADETRPRLQGARLTAFELQQNNIPVTVISDNMAGWLFSHKKIDCVIVGADRILKTGHVVNKIGTKMLAIVAKYYGVPFYVAAPKSTFDLKTDYKDVVIEERDRREVTHIGSHQITPTGVPVINPAFDITPPEFVTAIITEKGIIYSPYEENIKHLFKD
ncbi:MAG: S-methyl-5-thioribose-1-phosphate isomerase [Candidatus Helarchaeota archaeon]|nr:S-methyl-5-thioribose-1-phosphate isomerase [Candidatus Helarchaeota archaeon]